MSRATVAASAAPGALSASSAPLVDGGCGGVSIAIVRGRGGGGAAAAAAGAARTCATAGVGGVAAIAAGTVAVAGNRLRDTIGNTVITTKPCTDRLKRNYVRPPYSVV